MSVAGCAQGWLERRSQGTTPATRAAFNPDLVLRIETRRKQLTQYTENSTYWIGAWEAARGQGGRQVSNTALATVDFPGALDSEASGTGMAAKVIERMAVDGILPACASPSPTAPGAKPFSGSSR